MKKFKLFYLGVAAVLAALAMVSCGEGNGRGDEEGTLTFSQNHFDVPFEGGTYNFTIECDHEWEASCANDYVKFSPSKGKGRTEMAITLGQNVWGERDAYIYFYVKEEEDYASISVHQEDYLSQADFMGVTDIIAEPGVNEFNFTVSAQNLLITGERLCNENECFRFYSDLDKKNLKIELPPVSGEVVDNYYQLQHCKNFTYFDCSGNKLLNLHSRQMENLETLICRDNVFFVLHLDNNVALKTLDCSNNPELYHMQINDSENLETLDCSNCVINMMDILGCQSVVTLDCSNNQIPFLNLSGNTAIRDLNLSNNMFGVDELDEVFGYLPTAAGTINISGNPGAQDCDVTIAEEKGWTVVR